MKHIFCLLPFILAAHLWLAVDIYARVRQMPHWNYYFDYISLYSAKEFGTMLIAPWSPWILTVIIPFVSFLVFVDKAISGERNGEAAPLKIVAGLTGLSVAQFTYFLGRSHPNNIFHISIPIILLASFWMVFFLKKTENTPKAFYPAFLYCCYFAMISVLLSLVPRTAEKLYTKLKYYPQLQKNFVAMLKRAPATPQVAEAIYLLNKYAKNDKRVAVFLSPDDTTETLILSKKTHLFPLSYAVQDSNLPSARLRLLDFKYPFKDGGLLFLSTDCSDFQKRLVGKIQQEFKFLLLEATPHGIYAIKLGHL